MAVVRLCQSRFQGKACCGSLLLVLIAQRANWEVQNSRCIATFVKLAKLGFGKTLIYFQTQNCPEADAQRAVLMVRRCRSRKSRSTRATAPAASSSARWTAWPSAPYATTSIRACRCCWSAATVVRNGPRSRCAALCFCLAGKFFELLVLQSVATAVSRLPDPAPVTTDIQKHSQQQCFCCCRARRLLGLHPLQPALPGAVRRGALPAVPQASGRARASRQPGAARPGRRAARLPPAAAADGRRRRRRREQHPCR